MKNLFAVSSLLIAATSFVVLGTDNIAFCAIAMGFALVLAVLAAGKKDR